MMDSQSFRIKQDGQIVATVHGPASYAETEVMHYARQYLDDGDLVIEQKLGGRWRKHLKMSKAEFDD